MKIPRSLSAFSIYRNKANASGRSKISKKKKSKSNTVINKIEDEKADSSILSNIDDSQASTSNNNNGINRRTRVSNQFNVMNIESSDDNDDQNNGDKSSDYSDVAESDDPETERKIKSVGNRLSLTTLKSQQKTKPSNFSESRLRASGIRKSISKSLPMLKMKTNLNRVSGKLINDTIKNEITQKPVSIRYSSKSASLKSHEEKETSTMPPYLIDSRIQAQRCFEWLINPFNLETFFREIWEQKPLVLKRKKNDYYAGVFSTKELDTIIRENHLFFSKNIDLTSYENDERKTHNGDGRAYAPVVWDSYENGRSIRLLNPQTFSKSVWKLCSVLQEFLGSFVGANVYLTPPNSQGFAPHYDDIEAFILQLEGKKSWKIYAPLTEATTLPRYSSKNFSRDDLRNVQPLQEITLEPGDLMYFPRGFVHEASTVENEHSLHITISASQRNTFGDLFELMLPQALQHAFDSDIEFRKSLPRDYLNYMGIANQEKIDPRRYEFIAKMHLLMKKLINHLNIDSAVDQKAKDYLHECLPPVLNEQTKQASIHGGGEHWNDGHVVDAIELEPDTKIKLIRYGLVRLVMEEENVRLYHTMENSREYRQYDKQYVEIDAEKAMAVEFLINAYPNYVLIEQLPLDKLEDKIEIANLLYDKGLISIIEPEEMDD